VRLADLDQGLFYSFLNFENRGWAQLNATSISHRVFEIFNWLSMTCIVVQCAWVTA
jgi:hypothetical protein